MSWRCRTTKKALMSASPETTPRLDSCLPDLQWGSVDKVADGLSSEEAEADRLQECQAVNHGRL